MVKNLPAMQETQFWFLGQKDPLEKGMDTHSSILAWEISWTEEPGGLQRVRYNLATKQYRAWESFNPLMTWLEHKGRGKESSCSPGWLSWDIHLSCSWMRIYISSALGSQASDSNWKYTTSFLGLLFTDGRCDTSQPPSLWDPTPLSKYLSYTLVIYFTYSSYWLFLWRTLTDTAAQGVRKVFLLCCCSWTAAHQACLSFTFSQSLLKLMPIESVMPSNHLILCHPLPLLPSIFLSIRIFSNESALHIRWPKYWSFSINSSNEYSGVISFRIDWFNLLAVQETLKSLLQYHISKALGKCSLKM